MNSEKITQLSKSFATITLGKEPTVYEISCFEEAIQKALHKEPSKEFQLAGLVAEVNRIYNFQYTKTKLLAIHEWEDKYDLIFSARLSERIKQLMPFEYDDPDSSYQEDLTAFVNAMNKCYNSRKIGKFKGITRNVNCSNILEFGEIKMAKKFVVTMNGNNFAEFDDEKMAYGYAQMKRRTIKGGGVAKTDDIPDAKKSFAARQKWEVKRT